MPELFAIIPIIILPFAVVLAVWGAVFGFFIIVFILNIIIGIFLTLFGSVLWLTFAILQLSHFLAIIGTAFMMLTYFYGLISKRDNIGEGVFSVMSDYGFSHSALMSLISKQRQNDVLVKGRKYLFQTETKNPLGEVYVLFYIDFLILAFAFDFDYLAKFDFLRNFFRLPFLNWAL